jgi:hypothetical protein
MQFIIVADNNLAPLARQIAHALSKQKTHSGAFWSVKHYKDNEPQLDGKQPVIFLGDHELTESYVNILPTRFYKYGTRCYHEGSKAVLVAETPSDVSPEDLNELRAALDQHQDQLRQLAKAGLLVGVIAGDFWTNFLTAVIPGGGMIGWALKYLSAQKRRQEYSKLQYDYLLARFLVDEFEAYVNGLERH